MKLICIGDSLTYGYGIPRRDTWVTLAAARTGIELVNAGINGDTTGGMLARFQSHVISKHPSAVLIMGGSNDMMTGCPSFVPQSNVMGMVHQALAVGIIAMVGIPIPCWFEGIREDWADFASAHLKEENLESYRAWLLNFGNTFGVPVVDFWPPFLELQHRGEASSCYIDGLHPTQLGHKLMAQVLCAAMESAGLC